MAQNDNKFCLSCFISQEPYITWLSFMVHLCEMMISPDRHFFPFFFKFWFFGLLVGWKVKKWSKMTKNCVCCSPYLRKHTSYDCDFSCTFVRNHKSWSQEPDIIWSSFVVHKCVKWWYLQQFFSFFQSSDFSGFYG